MLTQHTLQRLRRLKLDGMADAVEQHLTQPAHAELSFEERFGLLVDRELTSRNHRRLARLLKAAKIKHACVEDINYRHSRGLTTGMPWLVMVMSFQMALGTPLAASSEGWRRHPLLSRLPSYESDRPAKAPRRQDAGIQA